MLCTFRLRIPDGPEYDVGAGLDFPGTWVAGSETDLDGDGGGSGRKDVLAVIGVQTGFTTDFKNPKYNYAKRRDALRRTWFPPTQEDLEEVESSTGLVMRFVIGSRKTDVDGEAEIAAEAATYGGFLRLDIEETYLSLTNKTLTFFKTVMQLYNPQYIIKVDDDVYMRVDRVPAAIAQWRERKADYIGCMKNGPVLTNPRQRWYEPQHSVLGQTYFTHTWGCIYALSGRAAGMLARKDPSSMRSFSNEDVTIGSWMLSMNVKHFDERRLCERSCSSTSIAVFDFPLCAGLCDAAEQMPKLHESYACRTRATNFLGNLPMLPSLIEFVH
jgi:galactosylxylosylprotein 3-beta-galactosyltransferase